VVSNNTALLTLVLPCSLIHDTGISANRYCTRAVLCYKECGVTYGNNIVNLPANNAEDVSDGSRIILILDNLTSGFWMSSIKVQLTVREVSALCARVCSSTES
jgi:hypothetical protein